MSQQTVAHYRILKTLDEKPPGLYHAEDLNNGTQVALRLLPAELGREERKRLVQFATVASELAHPNVETLLEIGENDDGRVFWSTELRPADTLDVVIARGSLPARDALVISLQMAAGLEQIHRAGIIHGALRPELVKVLDSGALVCGFGLFSIGGKGLSVRIGDPLVALAYRSPEQLRGDPISRRADVWSLGVILYEMIAGRRPFRGSTAGALAEHILGGTQRPLSAACGTPQALDRIVARALAKETRKRYPTVGELARELKALAPQLAAVAPPRKSKKRPTKRKTRRKAASEPKPDDEPGSPDGDDGGAAGEPRSGAVKTESASGGEADNASGVDSAEDATAVEIAAESKKPRDAKVKKGAPRAEPALPGAASSPGVRIVAAVVAAFFLAGLAWILTAGF